MLRVGAHLASRLRVAYSSTNLRAYTRGSRLGHGSGLRSYGGSSLYLRPEGAEGTIVKGDGGNQGALSGAIRYLMSTDEYSAMMRVRYRFVKIHSTMHVNEVR